MPSALDDAYWGVFRSGHVVLDAPCPFPEGARVLVLPAPTPKPADDSPLGRVVVAGFGLAGRCVVELIEREGAVYTIVERNPATVTTQRELGRTIVEGDISDRGVAERAGIGSADVLALTVPDEQAVLAATKLARELNPNIYIIARTTFASRGMEAFQLGADDVVKSEQAVALEFYRKLKYRMVTGTLMCRDAEDSEPSKSPNNS